MSIRYSGSAREIVVGVAEILAELDSGREPPSRPVERGTIEVRPGGGTGPVAGGAFDLTVEDRPAEMNGYRFLLTGELPDPCRSPRDRAQRARRELETARRDGVSQNGIRLLEQALAARIAEVDDCVAGAGLRGVPVGSPVRLARSGNLFRTAEGGNAREDGLRLLVRVLTPGDVDALNALPGVTISTFFATAALAQQVAANLPPDITVDRVLMRAGRLRVEFTADKAVTVSGSMEIEAEPSTSHDLRRLVSLRMVAFDLDGVVGELAEILVKEARAGAEKAVFNTEARMNSQLTRGLIPLTAQGGTATLIAVEEAGDGIHASVAIAFLRGGRADPCQAIRDDIRLKRSQLRVAERDGTGEPILNRLRAELAARSRDLETCRDATAPPPPPPPVLRTVPLVRELSPTSAGKRVRDAGLTPRFTGPTSPGTPFVHSQSPVAGTRVPEGSTVTMVLRVGSRE